MMKKIVISVLVVSVLGAIAAALVYQMNPSGDQNASASSIPVLEQQTNDTVQETQPEDSALQPGEPQAVAQGAEGDDWQATGMIVEIDDNGLTMDLETGESVYVELALLITGKRRGSRFIRASRLPWLAPSMMA